MPSSTSQLVTKTDTPETFQLMDLPPELRVCIYEYSFTPGSLSTSDKILERFDSLAPSNAILLTNHLIHQEARPIYEQACRRFWTYSVSANVEKIDPRAPITPEVRLEIRRRFSGRRVKPELKFTLVEDHLHVELVYRCTTKRLWYFLVAGNGLVVVIDNPDAQPRTASGS